MGSQWGQRYPFLTWKQVPMEPPPEACFFLEIFAGKAGLTRAVLDSTQWYVLPPVEVTLSELVVEPANVFDPGLWMKIRNWVRAGAVSYLHFGTPCTTYSRARNGSNGGPGPLRSMEHLQGLPGLSPADQLKVDEGNRFLLMTVELILLSPTLQWSIENPASSLMWSTPELRKLAQAGAGLWIFHACAYGAPYQKPTGWLSNVPAFSSLAATCPGGHTHEVLQGKEWCEVTQQMQWKTKKAQAYTPQLCLAVANLLPAPCHKPGPAAACGGHPQ